MSYLKKAAIVLTACACVISSNATAGEFFTDQGSMWTGGYLGFIQAQSRNVSDPTTSFIVAPVFRYFPCKYFLVGLPFSWSTSSAKNYSSYTLSIGPEIGFAYGNSIPVIPYVLTSIRYFHYTYDNTSILSPYSEGYEGYEIPLATGIMVPIVDGLGFQAEMGYRYQHVRGSYSSGDAGAFYISAGICGIGKKFAISLMNMFMD